jgi:hypothetical protein
MNPRDNFDSNRQLDERDAGTEGAGREPTPRGIVNAGPTQIVPGTTEETIGTSAAGATSRSDSADTSADSDKTEKRTGMPGDGAGRRDEIGGKSGVYPFTDAPPGLDDAPVRRGAEWGQGERGPDGYYDAGTSEGSPAATAQELLEDPDAG